MRAKYQRGAFWPLVAVENLEEGQVVDVDIKTGRSPQQHRLLFHAIRRAFDTWPEDHRFQPSDETQLRYWLEIECGWGDCITFHDPRKALEFVQSHWRDNMWTEVYDDLFCVYLAKSIKYGRMERGDFKQLVDRMDQVLMHEIGVGLLELKDSAVSDVQ